MTIFVHGLQAQGMYSYVSYAMAACFRSYIPFLILTYTQSSSAVRLGMLYLSLLTDLGYDIPLYLQSIRNENRIVQYAIRFRCTSPNKYP